MPRSAADGPRNLLTSLVLVAPLFVIYHLGVLLTLPVLNGADFVTTFLLRDLAFTVPQYLAFVATITILFFVALGFLRRGQHFQRRLIVPVLLESTIYAMAMGSVIVLFMTRVLGFSPKLAFGLSPSSRVAGLVMSAGAGLYEETVFRLGLLTALVAAGERVFRLGRGVALLFGLLLSAAAFSAMHHVPPYGDPFSLGVFTFRLLAGVLFGLLFWLRGYAVAVYTHALYDVFVMVLR